ncbi:DUF262 domain-containing protein [Roseomonas alkaliterrae]|uniref:Uncharacterized protein with ParB-like and HNH nuclease domain n=1 Tax=Neoroseomonas alkaliterrae TaxID=1452450 RepID=A0A840YA53_9PROT|nr:DUF262 domain-containing protein [Neoroseomonas alkaliterrae]MBB5690883.1 uncharacterized protein with ParB-like and HNH nuclease domain [Neoroseomonas alkaliterrae]MBR0677197.1 DUF262 domain-containing protein [Neoroseomonas alkaliterrae]
MDVQKSSLLAIFDAKQRLEVPLFQRQYVWNEDQQWLPLWEDIQRKFTEALEGRKDAPLHFLGAMVLDQKQTPTGHVVVRQVIDGQQRLTTLQIFLSAYRDFCRSQGCDALAAECDKFLFNTGMMADPQVDRFKVWPTQADRAQFTDVISAGSRDELERRHPLVRRPYARKPDPRPRMVEAYLFFFNQLAAFFLGEDGELPLAGTFPLSARVDECFQTLRSGLMVVVIDLQKDDDPQVIFETLNARGEPLLPADLLRNYIFLRAGRERLDVEAVYKQHWAAFDDNFWRGLVKQGRLNRPRSDLFMQHFLASQQGQDIPIKHLYVEYRHWVETKKPFASVSAELAALSRQGAAFRRIIQPAKGDAVFGLCSFLETFDIRTAYPFLLALMDLDLDAEAWKQVSDILESYLFRRAVCGLDTKNYNRIFLSLTRNLRREGFSIDGLRSVLLGQTGESGVWPDDATFREAWLQKPLYGPLNSPKLVHLYSRLNQTFMSSKAEALAFSQPPTIEHIMPRDWITNWPLPDGTRGLTFSELSAAPSDDVRAIATRKRHLAIHTLGNLTILSSALNSAQGNSRWEDKKIAMKNHSLLPINQSVVELDAWDEAAILDRAESLFERARHVWGR